MTVDYTGLRILALHAHPDDETLYTGGTLSYYAARGADVSVLTATLGEEGEVIGEEYSQLVANNGGANQLGGYRIHELMGALSAMGARAPQFLGGAGHFRDSGMVGSPTNNHPRAYMQADKDYVAELMACWIRRLRPHIVLIYDADGTYGHPDHRQTHLCGAQAVDLAASYADPSFAIISDSGVLKNAQLGTDPQTIQQYPAWDTPRLYWMMQSYSRVAEGLKTIANYIPPEWILPEMTDIFHTPDGAADVCVLLDDAAYEAKIAALRAHATQVTVYPPQENLAIEHPVSFALSNNIAQPLLKTEEFHLVRSSSPISPPDAHDIAAGLQVARIEE